MIEIRDLRKTFPAGSGLLDRGEVHALKGVSLELKDGAAISLIGESGCGKTTLGRILAGLEPHTTGDLVYDGVNLGGLPVGERQPHFRKVQMVHQDPYTALNPSHTILQSLFAPLARQARKLGKDRKWMWRRVRELMSLVGLDPKGTLFKYPHALSGGQRQRVVIARALTVDPAVLIADEAVSMIDVSMRLDILNLLRDLRERTGVAILFITHDVAAARYIAADGEICVLYQGEIVEYGHTDEIIERPVHPYTQAMLSAMPVLRGLEEPGPDRYIPLEGFEENASSEERCLFSPRCPFATDQCKTAHPPLTAWNEGSDAAPRLHSCFYPTPRRVVATPLGDMG